MSVHSLGVSQSLWLCFKTEKLLLSQIIETIPSSSHECLCEATQREGNTLSLNVYTHQKLQDLK